MERVAAGLALLLLAPFGAVVAIMIYCLSRSTPLVRHTRVGWRGAPLPMLKFRTMWSSGEASGRLLAIENVSGEIPFTKGAGDTRVGSRFAAFCRRHSIDELPQLFHVMRGEMSLVGPRPITRAELEQYYRDCADEVVSVRPGISGLWQIMGCNDLTYAERKQLDLLLVREASVSLYLSILVRSIPKVLSGSGSY